MTKNFTQNITKAAIILVLSLLAFMLEGLLPPIFPFAPFIKLGFSNIFLLLAIFMLSKRFVYAILFSKCLLSAVFSNFFSILYSLTGGILSVTFSILMIEYIFPKISLPAISAIASAIFNCAQLSVAMLITKTTALFFFFPIAVVLGFFTGAMVGFLVWLIGQKQSMQAH